MSEKKVVRGRGFVVPNNNRKFGADPEYINVWVQLPGSVKDVALLFTVEELDKAKGRAVGNEEDIYSRSSFWPVGYIEPEYEVGMETPLPDTGTVEGVWKGGMQQSDPKNPDIQ